MRIKSVLVVALDKSMATTFIVIAGSGDIAKPAIIKVKMTVKIMLTVTLWLILIVCTVTSWVTALTAKRSSPVNT
jgi:hypothetical protein